MSDMKCPKCGGRLVYWGATGAPLKCSQCGFGWGNEELWQELIRTSKALGTALDWLEQVATPAKCDDDLCREFTKRKLDEIKTALEQKDK